MRSYLDRGCPEGRAAACRPGAAHRWEEGLGSLRGWPPSAGCGPPHPSSGRSHLGPGRKEQRAAVTPRESQPRSQAPASWRGQEGADSRLPYPQAGTVWDALSPASPQPCLHNLWSGPLGPPPPAPGPAHTPVLCELEKVTSSSKCFNCYLLEIHH